MKHIICLLFFQIIQLHNLVQCQESSQSNDSILNYWSFKYDFGIGGNFNADGEKDLIKIKHQSKDSEKDLPTITYK